MDPSVGNGRTPYGYLTIEVVEVDTLTPAEEALPHIADHAFDILFGAGPIGPAQAGGKALNRSTKDWHR
jgi:hypothetical protein